MIVICLSDTKQVNFFHHNQNAAMSHIPSDLQLTMSFAVTNDNQQTVHAHLITAANSEHFDISQPDKSMLIIWFVNVVPAVFNIWFWCSGRNGQQCVAGEWNSCDERGKNF